MEYTKETFGWVRDNIEDPPNNLFVDVGGLDMSELKLKRYELPKEIHKFTKKEEAELFPKPGTSVLAYIDGDLTLLTFDWYHHSFKKGPDDEFVRDGNGETYFSSSEDDYIISKHNIRPFEEYWAVLE